MAPAIVHSSCSDPRMLKSHLVRPTGARVLYPSSDSDSTLPEDIAAMPLARSYLVSIVLVVVLVGACAPDGHPGTGSVQTAPGPTGPADRTLRIILRNEADNLAAKVLGS